MIKKFRRLLNLAKAFIENWWKHVYESIHSSRRLSRDDQQVSSLRRLDWSGLQAETNRYEKWAMFYKTQVYKQEGNSCTWQPGDGTRTHASQARLSPHDPTHSTLYGPFLTAGRPSLRISLLVVHSPKITEIVEKSTFPPDYPLWTIVAPRRATRLLDEPEHYCVSPSFRSFRSLLHRPGMVWLFCALFNFIAL